VAWRGMAWHGVAWRGNYGAPGHVAVTSHIPHLHVRLAPHSAPCTLHPAHYSPSAITSIVSLSSTHNTYADGDPALVGGWVGGWLDGENGHDGRRTDAEQHERKHASTSTSLFARGSSLTLCAATPRCCCCAAPLCSARSSCRPRKA